MAGAEVQGWGVAWAALGASPPACPEAVRIGLDVPSKALSCVAFCLWHVQEERQETASLTAPTRRGNTNDSIPCWSHCWTKSISGESSQVWIVSKRPKFVFACFSFR